MSDHLEHSSADKSPDEVSIHYHTMGRQAYSWVFSEGFSIPSVHPEKKKKDNFL